MFALVLSRRRVKSERQTMPSRRVIAGVLHNFLGTFTSRNSDFGGYWLFGFLVSEAEPHVFDLLGEAAVDEASPAAVFAHRLAAQQFAEQMAKVGLPRDRIREACVVITRTRIGVINDCGRSCYELRFRADAVDDLSTAYERKVSILVAPHDPAIEGRSARWKS
ncbi:hypothetical protein [Roseimicrobium sp. ORNL1]|uniref:hypothetical protein n=1 Tax=Roseimicrobium sp. ORNL1 TaxID=2711231 RepID=UPI0013E1596C|nr:hypothetical protein [Roseimicrobium sp. ORNL1]QIF03516.1 hypothetical protein G5S37_18960 [Roseimicrobium sp. ORNL1]